MDSTLKYKLEEFRKALDSLAELFSLDIDQEDLLRDATIKRFEYSFDLCHKLVKVFLEEEYGAQEKFVKSCFRALRLSNEFTEEDVIELLDLTDDRNNSVHSYDLEFAQKLYERIKDHYQIFEKVYEVVGKYVK